MDFPVVSHYEEDRPGAQGLPARGLVPASWRDIEGGTVTAMALDQFLRENGDQGIGSWADVDTDMVFPTEDAPVHVWITRARGGFDWQRLAELVKAGLPGSYDEVPEIGPLLRGLEQARKQDFEDWLQHQRLDGVVFPAAGDVGRDDLFTRPESMEHASQNGVVYSNGNRVLRHLGIPTVTVPMGHMADIQMPVGLTFAGPAYSDDALLTRAWAYERATRRRQKAFLTPSLPSNQIRGGEHGDSDAGGSSAAAGARSSAGSVAIGSVSIEPTERAWQVSVTVSAGGRGRSAAAGVEVWADGHILTPDPQEPGTFTGRISRSRPRVGREVLVLAKNGSAAEMALMTLPEQPAPTEKQGAVSYTHLTLPTTPYV